MNLLKKLDILKVYPARKSKYVELKENTSENIKKI